MPEAGMQVVADQAVGDDVQMADQVAIRLEVQVKIGSEVDRVAGIDLDPQGQSV
jgi:hypothetical protein